MRQRALEAGIREGLPLGTAIMAIGVALQATGQAIDDHESVLLLKIDEVQKLLTDTARYQRDMRTEIETRGRLSQASIERQEAVTFEVLTTKLTAAIQEKINTTLMMREHRWERISYWGISGIIAAIGMAILIGGYQWKAHVDRDANLLQQSCFRRAVQSPDGRTWCQWTGHLVMTR